MLGVPWLANLAQWDLSQYVVIQISSNFWTKDRMLLFPSPKNYWNGLKSLLGVMRLFSRKVAVLAALVHKPFLRKAVNIVLLSMACTWLNRVVNFCPTHPFYWGAPGAIYSNSNPILSCLQTLSKSTFSFALLQHMYWTWILYLVFKFLMRPIITFFNSNFSFWK